MGLKQILLSALFGAHLIGFLWLYARDRTPSRLLPVGVFTLLVLAQVFWDSAVVLEFGAGRELPLRVGLRAGAWGLAVPSLGLMFRRIYFRSRARQAAGSTDRVSEVGDAVAAEPGGN